MRGFVCNIVPKQLVVKLRAPQAPNNFCFSLIENKIFDQIVSLIPPSYFDNSIQDIGEHIIYMTGNGKYSIWGRKLKAVINSVKAAWILKKCDTVWFYNICTSNVITYILLRYIFRTQVYAILLDYTPSYNRLSLGAYIPWLYKQARGLISLSERTNIENKRMVYKAGIISSSKVKVPKLYNSKKKLKFLFSGNLGEHTGFHLALEVFKQLPQVELFISGNGEVNMADLSRYPNIHYLGYMEYEDYLTLYDKVDVCLSLRNPDYEENRNNFPSKIIEYFAYGKIVLSTLAYPELMNFNYIKSTYSVDALKQSIKYLSEIEIDELNRLCNNRDSLLINFSESSWHKVINEIEKL